MDSAREAEYEIGYSADSRRTPDTVLPGLNCAILVLIKGWKTEMVKRRVMFTFPQEHVREPIIYTLGNQFQLATNIRRADISEDKGWMVLELEGNPEEIERGIAWVTARGVRVDPAIGDGIEG